jgi:hypothetical protein
MDSITILILAIGSIAFAFCVAYVIGKDLNE